MPLARAIAGLLLVVAGICACDGTRPERPAIGEPARPGDELSWLQRFAIDRLLDFRVASGARAGFVALVARNGRVVYARTTGFADVEHRLPMSLDTRFHIASLTKPVTAVAAMILVEEGRLALEDPVSRYLPAFGAMQVVDHIDEDGAWTTRPLDRPIRIHDLLTFRSGIGGYAETDHPLDRAWRSPDIEAAGLGSLADRVARIPRLPLYESPGSRWRYGWSFDVLARVVEVAVGEPFEAFVEERIFRPLGMRATAWPDGLPPGETVAKMYSHDEQGTLVRHEVFDDYYGRGWSSGGGGLVSTAPDYLRLALMLANGGRFDETRILSEQTVAEMTRLHVPGGVLADMGVEGLGWGLGLCVVADADAAIMPARNGDFWWSGRFGTQFWISPEANTVVVVMQQTETGPHSDRPITPSLVQWLAMP
jgi:CubicO group peptidase (beta-lactamase class C family)